ncbi:MAG: outer membrane beta-barrel protein [Bacteroidales bacterium]|nr:outer membrane beta-barrel protein [Bacteroidales bacterium]
MKLIAKFLAVLGIAVTLASVYVPARAQVFGMKGGVTIGSITTKEVDSVKPMLNYYYEAYYGYRFARYKYWTIGVGYFGTGATFCGRDEANPFNYKAKVRFNNLVVPLKLKISAEGRHKPRPYFFVGAMPCIVYNYDEELSFSMRESGLSVPENLNTDYIFNWTPRRINLYALCGGGCYYRHFTCDFMLTINTLRDYKEIEAPISYNKSFIVTIGYQISRDRAKVW